MQSVYFTYIYIKLCKYIYYVYISKEHYICIYTFVPREIYISKRIYMYMYRYLYTYNIHTYAPEKV